MRDSLLWVGRRGKPGIYRQKAENLCFSRDLYTLTKPVFSSASPWDPHAIDASWAFVERRLTQAFDALITERSRLIDAKAWLTVLVEFASQIFVRGADFGGRLVNRLAAISPEIVTRFRADHSDNINGSRILELHRLRGAIIRAEWCVLHATDSRFVTNDLARTSIGLPGERAGYLIPLRADAALLLVFGADVVPNRLWPAEREDRWLVGPIRHMTVSSSDVRMFNGFIAESAQMEIFGAPEELIRELHVNMASATLPLEEAEPILLLPYRDMGDSRAHEQLVIFVHTPPSQVEERSGGGGPDPGSSMSP